MAVVVDTADVPPQERSDAWTAANLQVFEPIAVQPRATRPFEGRLVRHELGPLQVLRLSADASIARRTPDLIRSGDPDCVQIMLQLSGACGVAQEDRSSVIREGDLGSWHSSRPYVVEAESPFEMLIVTCPSPLLRPHSDRVRRRTARCIDGSAGMGRLLRLHLTTLLQVLDADACPEAGRAHLAESLFDLILALHAPDDAPARSLDRARVSCESRSIGSSTPTCRTPGWTGPPSLDGTSSRVATSTGSTSTRRSASRRPSGPSGSIARAATSTIRRSPTSRSSQWRPGGDSSARRTSAAHSVLPTTSPPPSSVARR
jgi:hypothetical protein